MHFLEYLDEQYIIEKNNNNILNNNKQYRYYKEVVPIYESISEQRFEFVKIYNKSKVLLCFKSLKVYLSDFDILNTIVKFKEKEISWFVDEFIKIYKHNEYWLTFKFEIENKIFTGIGLPYKESDTKIQLHTDNEVNINSFIFIINIILTKDFLATAKLRQSENPIKREKNLLKSTLCKYISLLKHYSVNNNEIINYLIDIEYPINEELDYVFSSYDKTRNINKLFDNYKLFEEKVNI